MPTAANVTRPEADATRFRLHVLDMGRTKYGDCLVVEAGTKRILIDGGHPGDEREMEDGTPSIPDQLKNALKVQQFPIQFDLLVITHMHADHIGCLPAMVKSNLIRCKHALVADPDLGYGKNSTDAVDIFDSLPTRAQQFALLLREEIDVRHMTDSELEHIVSDAMTQKQRYESMLDKLKADGCNVVRYRKPEDAAGILNTFKSTGMKLLGPTKKHLEICRDEIRTAISDAAMIVSDSLQTANPTFAEMYGALLSADAEPSRPGNAVNSQSIILSFEKGGERILLTADMQLADPDIPRLEEEMKALRQTIAAGGPYDVVKLGHHCSHNAVDPELLEDWKAAQVFIHTGGWDDKGHPAASALRDLKKAAETNAFAFLRNDRNGRIGIDLISGDIELQKKKTTNDFSKNDGFERDVPRPKREIVTSGGTIQPKVETVQVENQQYVEVITRIPRLPTSVSITIKVEPLDSGGGGVSHSANSGGTQKKTDLIFTVGGGRDLPELIYLTSSPRLAERIGTDEAAAVMSALSRAPGQVVDVGQDTDFRRIGEKSVAALKASGAAGVVIVGGAEVIPPVKLNTVPAALESHILDLRSQDMDSFVVWSDEYVADFDGDADAESPVSRIPDCGSFAFLATSLSTGTPQSGNRVAGVRNSERPFADMVYSGMGGQGVPRKSYPHLHSDYARGDLNVEKLYVMLHGDSDDSTKFWGEDPNGGYPIAMTIDNLDDHQGAIALAGCCWGALAFTPKAASTTGAVATKAPDQSIALRFLERGGKAFVGCTGTHYSPVEEPFDYFGKPMHDAFWAEIKAGRAPALALHNAKERYAQGIPHGLTSPYEQAIEHKILRQFTCLGLGW